MSSNKEISPCIFYTEATCCCVCQSHDIFFQEDMDLCLCKQCGFFLFNNHNGTTRHATATEKLNAFEMLKTLKEREKNINSILLSQEKSASSGGQNAQGVANPLIEECPASMPMTKMVLNVLNDKLLSCRGKIQYMEYRVYNPRIKREHTVRIDTVSRETDANISGSSFEDVDIRVFTHIAKIHGIQVKEAHPRFGKRIKLENEFLIEYEEDP